MGNLMDVEVDENGQPVKEDAICSESSIHKNQNSEISEKLTITEELKLIKYLSGSSNNQPFHLIGVSKKGLFKFANTK
jgi:hypothetical protein